MNSYNRYVTILGLVLAVFLIAPLSGCSSQKQAKKDVFFDKWKAKAETSKGYSPSPKKRVIDLKKREIAAKGQEPAVKVERSLPTQEVSLTMHDIDVAVLLRALARAADMNILINESVKGRADVNIKKAPWDQVFNGVLSSHGLTYAWVGDIIRIMTIEDRDQDLKREAQKKEFKQAETPSTQIVSINYADPKKLKENLERFLTVDKEGKPIGSIMVDDHTHSLIIQAIPDDFVRLVELIQELDRPTSQILIEAHIVETTRTTARELGIQWGGLYRASSAGHVNHWITPGAKSSGITGGTLYDAAGNPLSINPTSGNAVDFPAALGTTGLTLGYVVEDVGRGLLSVQLSALQEEGKLNILSSPSITTLDNQTAEIESGKEVPYQTVEDGEVKIEYKKAVLRLEVVPHVIDGQTLTMDIHTTKDELDFANAVGGQPAITTKMAKTKVVLRDGETTVIGGLNKEKADDAERGVPGLKDLPLLGYFFKGEDKSKEMEDVLIFITPHILKEYLTEATHELPEQTIIPQSQPPESVPQPGENMVPQAEPSEPGPVSK